MELPSYSLLDVLNENLKKAGRRDFLHRIVYVFDYNKLVLNEEEVHIHKVLHSMILKVNESANEPISGLLLLYNKYGVHMIEGSEESIFAHFQELTDSEVIAQCVPRIKILLTVTHIAQRMLNRWMTFMAQPQTLLEEQENSGLQNVAEETTRRITEILQELHKLWNYMRFHSMGSSWMITMDQLSDRMTFNLPEYARIEFVLATPALKDLRMFVDAHRTVQQPRLYQELICPPQKEFIPFNIFISEQQKGKSEPKIGDETSPSK